MNGNFNLCQSCLEKQRTIDRLKQEVQSLREKVHCLERKSKQGPFGSSTPSAKIPLKANTAKQQRSKSGVAKRGHTGHGEDPTEFPLAHLDPPKEQQNETAITGHS